MSLITPDYPVTGGMQTSDLLSVNSLSGVKDFIQRQQIVPVFAETSKPRCWQPAARVKFIFWMMTKVRPSLCDPLCCKYGLPVSYYCASLQLGPNVAPIIRGTFLLQGGMRSLTSNSVVTDSFCKVKSGDSGFSLSIAKSMMNPHLEDLPERGCGPRP